MTDFIFTLSMIISARNQPKDEQPSLLMILEEIVVKEPEEEDCILIEIPDTYTDTDTSLADCKQSLYLYQLVEIVEVDSTFSEVELTPEE
jgi:hypothetical protein